MGYNFYGFTSSDFEDLVQAIFQKILGNSSIVYGIGADGARELTFNGKANFGSVEEVHDGLWIVQAKFKSRDVHERDQYSWVRSQFLKEIQKFKSGNYPVPNQYIFVTNCVLTPAFERGGRDKMQSIIELHKDLIPQIYIVSYDELCKLTLNNADVRQAFGHLLHPGDQLAEIKEILSEIKVTKNLVLAHREIRNLSFKQSATTFSSEQLLLNVDFGTSFSLCSVFNHKGDIELVPTVTGEPLLHSIVTFFKNGYYIVGNQSLKQADTDEILTITNIKRELGTGKKYNIFGKRYSPEEIASMIVKSLKTSAEEFFGFEFTEVVVSKPSNYNIRQTKALNEVFKTAGLRIRRILDEGSSPSFLLPKVIHEYIGFKKSITFLVIDLGGGTFDLSVQEYEDDVFETKAVLGDNLLGGIDYDLRILDFITKKMRMKYPGLHRLEAERYIAEAERVKKVLTYADTCQFIIEDFSVGDGNLIDLNLTISRSEFRECTSSLNTMVMQYLTKVLSRLKTDSLDNPSSRLDAVMLTGQGAKIFTVKEIISHLFPNIPIVDRYMENAVCLGNAHQAGILSGFNKNSLALNVQNTSLAIMAAQSVVENSKTNCIRVPMAFEPSLNTVVCYLIKSNSSVPNTENFVLELKVAENFATFCLPIYEFSNSNSEYEIIDEIKIPVSKGMNQISVRLEIDANYKILFRIKNDLTQHTDIHTLI